MTLSSLWSLGVFVAISFAVASSGAIFKPGDWYKRLSKPNWTPPDWAFPVVWSVLFIMIAVSGWLVYERAGFVPTIFAPFAFQLIVNALWSWLFFGLRRPDLAFVDMIALWLGIAANIMVFSHVSTTAAGLLVPYLVWVTIAGCLNWSVWRRNLGRFAGRRI